MERMMDVGQPGMVGKYRDEQVAHMSNWATIPDQQAARASMFSIHVIPRNGTTVTMMNPLDTGDPSNSLLYEHDAAYGTLIPARGMR